MRLACLVSAVLVFALPASLPSLTPAAAQSVAGSPSPQDTTAIDALVASLSDAWNRGDAKAFAAHYAADGSFTNILGTTLYGHDPFEKQHNAIFSTIYKGSTNSLTIDRVHLIRPDVAVVDVTSRLSGVGRFPPGIQSDPDGAIHTKLQLVLTRESDEWWIAAFHNVVAMPTPPHP